MAVKSFDDSLDKKKLAEQFAEKKRAGDEKLLNGLTEVQQDFLWSGREDNDEIKADIVKAMRDSNTVLSDYVSKKLNWLFDGVIPKRDREAVLYLADRLHEYPYMNSYYRRPFRSKDNFAYISWFISEMRKFFVISDFDFIVDAPIEDVLNRNLPEDVLAYLDRPLYGFSHCGYNQWQIAYALDNNNKKAEESIYRILTDENYSARMTADLVRGIACSHRQDFHDLLAKLLLAAKLQEGLRQTICENADMGTKECFMTILKTVDENDLLRYSSVRRAVGVWLGLMSPDERDVSRISDKSVRLMLDCLTNESLRRQYLESEDSMEIYISLWSYAFDDVDFAVHEISEIIDCGSTHQILVAGYFAYNIELQEKTEPLAKKTVSFYRNELDILAVWLSLFMHNYIRYVSYSMRKKKKLSYTVWFDDENEVREYYTLLKNIKESFSGKEKIFSPCVFPWFTAKLSKESLGQRLCVIAHILGDNDIIDEVCGYIGEFSESRDLFFSFLLSSPKTQVQRNYLLAAIADKQSLVRNTAHSKALTLELSATEYMALEANYKYKDSEIRRFTAEHLLRQDDEHLAESISRLLESKEESFRLGGIDLLHQLKNSGTRSFICDSFIGKLSEMSVSEKLSSKESVMLKALLPEAEILKKERVQLFSKDDKYIPDVFDEKYISLCIETYKEYFPDSKLPEQLSSNGKNGSVWDKIKSVFSENETCKSYMTAVEDLVSLSRFIDEHKMDSFVQRDGETELLGNLNRNFGGVYFRRHSEKALFEDLWHEWVKTNGITNQRIVRAAILCHAYKENSPYIKKCKETVKTVFGNGFEKAYDLPYFIIVSSVFDYLVSRVPQDERVRLASAFIYWFIRKVPDEMIMIYAPTGENLPAEVEKAHLLYHDQLDYIYRWLDCGNNENLKNTFPLAVASAERCITEFAKIPKIGEFRTEYGIPYIGKEDLRVLVYPFNEYSYKNKPFVVGHEEYLFAAYRGIISEAQLYEFLFDTENIRASMKIISSVASYYYEKGKQVTRRNRYSMFSSSEEFEKLFGKKDSLTEDDEKLIEFIVHLYETMIPIIVSSELSRGEEPTEYTVGVSGINRLYGAEYFVDILYALGNDALDRRSFVWSMKDRKTALSYLLSVSIPSDKDSMETLRKALSGKNISEKRLVEAAFYSPEWIHLVGKYLGIGSFESVCYYFMAHINENFDDKRKAIIAKYTPLSVDELNEGAFDKNWFNLAYGSVNKKTFDMIYDAAKYITSGIKHSRARKYADAVLGKMNVEETEQKISDKRNKDLLMAYALIPLKDDDDLVSRYLYIRKFQKESKNFGSQRAASEAKAVESAFQNLAINAGFFDTIRLALRMETKIIDDSRELLNEQLIDNVSFKIVFNESGKPDFVYSKDGKKLTGIPAALKKNETVVAMGNLKKLLTEQYRRTRVMLENSMEDGSVFTFGELSALASHPVVFPMLERLVFISGDSVGFFTESGLKTSSGDILPLSESSEVHIAHPFELYKSGCWRDYQKYLYDNKEVQPFRQVFRELYVKTAEESETCYSYRYAGNQVQPSKTVATLKTRHWVADMESGLQKVYYKENIVAHIYVLADWFSPSDIESPTIEYVCFFDRHTWELLKISDIPDVVFSEVMRDVDLAVSVAHAGGVDPETSHSTMEMRGAILSFVLPMFRIDNVKIEGHHAIINGKLADYTVHLGSGVVHQIGGAMIPVLPVHSQHRGKIFLPFVDDDPKTAEVISKVLLFAEDSKIKDPMILGRISK